MFELAEPLIRSKQRVGGSCLCKSQMVNNAVLIHWERVSSGNQQQAAAKSRERQDFKIILMIFVSARVFFKALSIVSQLC